MSPKQEAYFDVLLAKVVDIGKIASGPCVIESYKDIALTCVPNNDLPFQVTICGELEAETCNEVFAVSAYCTRVWELIDQEDNNNVRPNQE